MRDFTRRTYKYFISELKKHGYEFQTVEEFLTQPKRKVVVLRHDIDLKKRSCLAFAKIENDLGIRSTYYFRMVRKIFDPKIIKTVASYGHEVGYHYENLSMCGGEIGRSIVDFGQQLEKLRKVVNVTTICMHGNTLSKYDNKELWNHIDYRDYGLIGEVYFDVDFSKVLYLTDTAQRWNGHKIAIRDKVKSNFNFDFRSTFDILESIDKLPDQILITSHPDRWTNNLLEWYRIDIITRIKALIKVHYLSKRAKVIIK